MNIKPGYILVFSLFLLYPGFLHAQSPGQALNPSGFLSLEETLSVLGPGAEFRWDPLFRSGYFSQGGRRAAFAAGLAGETGAVLVDGRDLVSLPLPYIDQGVLRFPEAFSSGLGALLRPPPEDPSRFRIAAIVIDPGHGGRDPGTTATHVINGKSVRLVEKDIALRVSGELRARLNTAYPDKRVLMTRTGDTYPSLEDRMVFAHSVSLEPNEAIIYISVHVNASFNKAARGYEVWYLPPEYRRTLIDPDDFDGSADVMSIRNAMLEEEFTTESILLAQSILKGFDQHLGSLMPSRGVKAQDWYVVRNARMPSVLVEMGFATNEDDAKLFNQETHLRKFSDAIYKGIIDFITLFERSGGFTAQS